MRSNLWTTKNPFMSMWLSAANQMMGSAMGHATAASRKQAATFQADAARQVLDFWSGKPARKRVAARPAARKKTRR